MQSMLWLFSTLLLIDVCRACLNDRDCSYNGRCIVGKECICDQSWQGLHCETLRLGRVSKQAGFGSPHLINNTETSSNLSTWGGSVLYDEHTQRWHMFASQMINNCGIGDWEPNSRVVHASAIVPEGPYIVESVLIDPFAHEPNAIRSPQGDWVIYFTMRHPAGFEINCTSRSSSTTASLVLERANRRHSRGRATTSHLREEPPSRHSYMIHSKSPYGPWSEPVLVLKANYSQWDGRKVLVDTNLAAVILPKGNVIGIWRKCVNIPNSLCEEECCTIPHLLVASQWKDPSTYRVSDYPIFDDVVPYGSEDPMLWRDGTIIHAILHDEQLYRGNSTRGRHAFSDDFGKTWQYGKDDAYNGSIVWSDDGTSFDLYNRERPHMILSPSGDRIVAISNGVVETEGTDRSWTMIQPILEAQSNDISNAQIHSDEIQ